MEHDDDDDDDDDDGGDGGGGTTARTNFKAAIVTSNAHARNRVRQKFPPNRNKCLEVDHPMLH